MLFSWLVTMASRPKGRHFRRVTLKMTNAESSTSPIACGRWGGYKTDRIREYYRYDRATHGWGAPGTRHPPLVGGASHDGAGRLYARRPTAPGARARSEPHSRDDSSGAHPGCR